MSVLVLLEQRGALKACALEAACKASQIAKKAGMDLHGVFIGRALDNQAAQLAGFGMKKVFAFESDKLEHYSSDGYVPIVRDLAKELGAKVIVGSASATWKEFSAAVDSGRGVERLLITAHRDEGESTGATGEPIGHDLHFDNAAATFTEYPA